MSLQQKDQSTGSSVQVQTPATVKLVLVPEKKKKRVKWAEGTEDNEFKPTKSSKSKL